LDHYVTLVNSYCC